MTDFDIRSSRLRFDFDDFEVVAGDTSLLALDGEVVASVSFEADKSSYSEVLITAVPVTSENDVIGLDVTSQPEFSLRVLADNSPPSFFDRVAAGFSSLKTSLLSVLAIAGVVLPFIWIPAVFYVSHRRFFSRRKRNFKVVVKSED